jgi:putative tryptophan/tyrosine transport system substrate-binding protein
MKHRIQFLRRRREFITLLGGTAALWPVAARAQQAKPVVGLLAGGTAKAYAQLLSAFLQGLNETGYIEGRSVAIEQRWAEGNYQRLPALADDLVQRQVSVLVALTTPAALVAKAATATIPVVFTTVGDPVQLGLVVTGATHLNVELAPKLLETIREAVPAATSVALIVNPTNPNAETVANGMRSAAGTLGISLHVLRVGNDADLDDAFAKLPQLRAGALAVTADVFLFSRREQIAAVALRQGLPSIYPQRDFAAAGGLMSYAGNNADGYHQAGIYAGRILKGEKPADLPVHQTTKVELVVNLRTAKALGITLPMTLLARADEVIE